MYTVCILLPESGASPRQPSAGQGLRHLQSWVLESPWGYVGASIEWRSVSWFSCLLSPNSVLGTVSYILIEADTS